MNDPRGPNTGEELLRRGIALLDGEDWPGAIADFQAVLEQEPDNAAACLGRGRALMHEKEFDLALDDFDAAVRLNLRQQGTCPIEVYRHRARCEYEFSLFDDLLEDAQRLIEHDPADDEAWYFRGSALSGLGDYEAALADLNESLRLNPKRGRAYYDRAVCLDVLGEEDNEEAEEDYRQSTMFGELDAWCYHRRAHRYEGREDFGRALLDFHDAVRLDPESVAHLSCRAELFLMLGLDELAENDYRKVEQLHAEESEGTMAEDRYLIYELVQEHFGRARLDEIEVTKRNFPHRAWPDVQVALDEIPSAGFTIQRFFATQRGREPVTDFATVYIRDRRTPVIPANPSYDEFDIGEDEPMRCIKNGLWLLAHGGVNLLVLLVTSDYYPGIRVEAAVLNGPAGEQAVRAFFDHVEQTVKKSRCYRGKVLSLDTHEMYSGQAKGIVVHKLARVNREEVILPPKTLDLLDRNVLQFVRRRPHLAEKGLATKKGLLFYGPPGTGKTHTIHYLAANLEGHTTFIVSAEEVAELSEYMVLARLYEPSIVVIEDVDLIARHRTEMRSAGEELLLNKLLNEMDGLKAESETIFVLTSNRPQSLEEALAARPGRIDQAIEFPLPDKPGREKLVRLYARDMHLPDDVVRMAVKETDGVSASFIKELMRRSIQFAFDREESASSVTTDDVELALEELLVSGGSLNRKLLGAIGHDGQLGFAAPPRAEEE